MTRPLVGHPAEERRARLHAGVDGHPEHRRQRPELLRPGHARPGRRAERRDAPTQVSNFNVNGQRANSNNMTIDGVANIDTGDNGGNMATTNLDSVAEFKVLTVELPGRVRPRGRRPGAGRHQERLAELHGVGLLVQPPLRVERQHLAEQPQRASQDADEQAQRLRLHVRRAALHPGRCSTRTRTSCSSSSTRSSSAARTRWVRRASRCRPRWSARVTSRRASTRTGTRTRTSGTTRSTLPCSATDTSGCFKDGGVLGKIPANRLYAPDAGRAEPVPDAERRRAGRATTTRARPRRTSRTPRS